VTLAPSALSIFEDRLGEIEAGGLDLLRATGSSNPGLADLATQHITSIVDAAQTVVDVLTDEDGRGYRISFAPSTDTGLDNPAFTVMAERKIVVSPKVFEGQHPLPIIATVLTGLVSHEIGHTRTTPRLRRLREAKWPGKSLPVLVSTIFEDRRLELQMIRDFPGLAESFDVTLWWAAQSGPFASKVWAFDPADPLGDRVNFVIAASRYRPYIGGIATDQDSVDEAAWWLALYESVNATTTDAQMMDTTVDALHRLLDNRPEPPKEEPPVEEPPGPVCGPNGPGPEGPNPGPGGPKGEGEGKGGNGVADDDDTDPDGDPEGDDGDDGDPDDDDTEGGDDDGPGPDGGTDGPTGQGKGKSGDGKADEGGTLDESKRHTDDDLEHVGEDLGKSDGSSTGTGQGSHEGRDDAEFDKSVDSHFSPEERGKVVNAIDDALTGTDRSGRNIENKIAEERTTQRVNEGEYGTLKVRLVF